MSEVENVICSVCGDPVTVPDTIHGYVSGGGWVLSNVDTSKAGMLSPYTSRSQTHGDHSFYAIYKKPD